MDFLGWGGGVLFVLFVGDSFFEVVAVFLSSCYSEALAGVEFNQALFCRKFKSLKSSPRQVSRKRG